jgi:glucose dehydrogenase
VQSNHRMNTATLILSGLILAVSQVCLGQHDAEPQVSTDKKATRYSPLDQISKSNVSGLRIAWRLSAAGKPVPANGSEVPIGGLLRTTPIFLNDTLYTQNIRGGVVAVDGASGQIRWEQPQPSSPGTNSRTMDWWKDSSGRDTRIFVIRGEYLHALNAQTGEPVKAFGTNGSISLRFDHPLAGQYSSTLGPLVVGDTVIVPGNTNGTGDHARKKEAASEDVRAFDARSGKLLWTFHVVPREGEPGGETWGANSWKYAGDAGVWNPMSADEELGLVYVATSTPTSSWYGGWRPGSNLYTASLVALDLRTGKLVWHYQMVHHDLWDYDNVGPAILGDITVDGRRIKAVMQANKTGFVFVLDRATGKPVWPIEERAVPKSTVPGEAAAPTQPFPTRPPALDAQGISDDVLIDYTPALKTRARELVKDYVMGPLFTPSVLVPGPKRGALVLPGALGTANWNTGAFDPETGIYYGTTRMQGPTVRTVVAQGSEATMAYSDETNDDITIEGLPIVRGPYGSVTALDLNKGTTLWSVANGDGPRNHPLLKNLHLPPLGIPNRGSSPLVTKTLLFVAEGSDLYVQGDMADWKWGRQFRAYDKATGEILAQIELPAGALATPMTYVANGKQFIVVTVGGTKTVPEYVALSLP